MAGVPGLLLVFLEGGAWHYEPAGTDVQPISHLNPGLVNRLLSTSGEALSQIRGEVVLGVFLMLVIVASGHDQAAGAFDLQLFFKLSEEPVSSSYLRDNLLTIDSFHVHQFLPEFLIQFSQVHFGASYDIRRFCNIGSAETETLPRLSWIFTFQTRNDRPKIGQVQNGRTLLQAAHTPATSRLPPFHSERSSKPGILSESVLEYALFGFRQSRESGNQTRLSFREASPGLGSKLALDWPGGPSFGNCATEW